MKLNLPIEFHSHHDGRARSFLVIVNDDTIAALNYGHPMRALQSAFNGGGRNSSRLFALAEALRDAEDGQLAYPGFFPHVWKTITAFLGRIFAPKHADDLLVDRFAKALKQKLAQARRDGRSGWQASDWMDQARAKLVEHVIKGDPRDVANFCAFLWHHGESTAPAIDDFNREHVPEPFHTRVTKLIHRANAPVLVAVIGEGDVDAYRVLYAECVAGRIPMWLPNVDMALCSPAALRAFSTQALEMADRRQIDLVDQVLFLNRDGMSPRMRDLLEYAEMQQKRIRYVVEPKSGENV